MQQLIIYYYVGVKTMDDSELNYDKETDMTVNALIKIGYKEVDMDERRKLMRVNYNNIVEYYNGEKWRFFIR